MMKANAQTTIDHIFLSSMELFRDNGYTGTNIRQIAERAGVSLGLVNHYFGSKRDLGYAVLETLIRYVVINVERSVERQQLQTMLLLDAMETRAVNLYLIHGPFRKFYIDTLEEDIFFRYLEHQPQFLLEQLQETYHFSISKDMALLYCRYIPYMVEKTLVLKKQQGLFPSIEEGEIPYHIFTSTYSGRVPQEILVECDRQASILAPRVVDSLAPAPSREILESFGLLPLKFLAKEG